MTSVWLVMVMTAGAPKVASPAWNVVDVKPELAAFYAEQLAQALRAEGLSVTTASDMATLLGVERQRELLGCSEGNSCLVELANALGCEATLTVNLARLGSSFRGLAKLMSSRDGSILSSVKIDAANEADLSDKLEAAAKALAGPLKKTGAPVNPVPLARESVVAQPGKVAPKAWWVPGALGVVAVGTGSVLIGLAGGKFSELNRATDSTGAAGLSRDGAAMQTSGWILGGVGLAAVAASVAFLVFGSTDVAPVLTIAPSGALLGLGGHF